MIKPSKYLLTFAGLSILLGTGVFITSQKFLPILLHHTVYYCQLLLQSFSLRIPNGVGTFLAGALFLIVTFALVKLAITYIKVVRFRKKLYSQVHKYAPFNTVVDRLGLSKKALLVASKKSFAFCHGVRYPKIYISTALYSMINNAELEAVLRHEKYHLEHKDSFILLLAEITQSLFPFFPLLSDLILNFRIERELAADQKAVHDLGNTQFLISVLKKLLTLEPIEHYAFTPALADHETLEVRIKALTNRDIHFRKFRLLNIVLSGISTGILVAFVGAPVQAIEMHGQEADTMMVCLQNDACTAWCKENQSVIPYSKTPMTPTFPSVE